MIQLVLLLDMPLLPLLLAQMLLVIALMLLVLLGLLLSMGMDL